MESFMDKVKGKKEVKPFGGYKCDKCQNTKTKFFIHMDVYGKDKYICSYLCSKDMHITYGKEYWRNVVNTEDFNHLRPIQINIEKPEKFRIEKDPYDGERYDFLNNLEEEDERVRKYEEELSMEDNSYSESE